RRIIKIPLAYSDGRFGGQSPPRCIWFCTWFGRQSRPNQVQNTNVSGPAAPAPPPGEFASSILSTQDKVARTFIPPHLVFHGIKCDGFGCRFWAVPNDYLVSAVEAGPISPVGSVRRPSFQPQKE